MGTSASSASWLDALKGFLPIVSVGKFVEVAGAPDNPL
jgi:hypothetical protein